MSFFKKKEPFTEAEYVERLFKDQVKDRRWRSFASVLKASAFLLMGIASLTIAIKGFPWDKGASLNKPHTAMINIDGTISNNSHASADKVNVALRKAFKNQNAQAIIIKINSPGGSAVQAGRIYDEILALKKIHPKPVYAIIDDIGASGGYYIAIAADKIYANRASIVGSIGVISSGFGFKDLMDKVGIERRVIKSGENKNFLDPFESITDEQRIFWEKVLAQTHQQFVERVKESRKGKINIENNELFTGLMWNGEQAKELGLVDDVSTPENVAREITGDAELIAYLIKDDLFSKFANYGSYDLKSMVEEINSMMSEQPILLK